MPDLPFEPHDHEPDVDPYWGDEDEGLLDDDEEDLFNLDDDEPNTDPEEEPLP